MMKLEENVLRPRTFKEFIGQRKIIKNLKVYIEATKKQGRVLDHILFYGPPGLGKTTLAHIIANELGVNLRATSGPVIERPLDLAGILTGLSRGDILFIDEIHRLPRSVEEYLYSAMEDFKIDIMLDKGPKAESVRISISPFTLIGATTRIGLLTAPLRARFGIQFRLEYYEINELAEIIKRNARVLEIHIEEAAAIEIARRSRGTPRIANRLLKRVRDFAEVKAQGRITREVALYAFEQMDVDSHGLDNMDRKILKAIIEIFGGGPVGIKALAMAIGEDVQTIEEVYEPFLLRVGFIKRTPRGRVATPLAYRYLGIRLL